MGITILVYMFTASSAFAEWSVDFSRRNKELRSKDYQVPSHKEEKESVMDFLFSSTAPIQDVVILNTARGFLPNRVAVQEGRRYRVHVVNVNDKEKNVSFVLDAFSEHHATYYGQIKSFHIHPQKEGVYTFLSPETSSQGQLVVHRAKISHSVPVRTPANR